MSARHVILGLLRERPSHPYDVAVRFGGRLKPWAVNRGQVYSTMKVLASEGLIETIDEHDPDSRSGSRSQLTRAGHTELDRWIATRSDEVEPLRGELLAKLAIAEPRHIPDLLGALDWYEHALAANLEQDVRDRQTAIDHSDWQSQIAGHVADSAILHRDAELIWVRRVRDFLNDWVSRSDQPVRRQRDIAQHG